MSAFKYFMSVKGTARAQHRCEGSLRDEDDSS